MLSDDVSRNAYGIPIAEATDPALQYAWHVGLPITDFSAAEMKKAHEAYSKEYPDADMDSLLWTLERQE